MAAMEELKLQRSKQKATVKTSANRLNKSIDRALAEKQIVQYYEQLEDSVLDFIAADSAYKAAIKDDESLVADYSVVNNLNLQQYTEAVDEIYNEAKVNYDKYGVRVVLEELNELGGDMEVEIRKIQSEEEDWMVEVYMQEIRQITKEIIAYKKKKNCYITAKWDEAAETIRDYVQKSEDAFKQLQLKVRSSGVEGKASLFSTPTSESKTHSHKPRLEDLHQEDLPQGFQELKLNADPGGDGDVSADSEKLSSPPVNVSGSGTYSTPGLYQPPPTSSSDPYKMATQLLYPQYNVAASQSILRSNTGLLPQVMQSGTAQQTFLTGFPGASSGMEIPQYSSGYSSGLVPGALAVGSAASSVGLPQKPPSLGYMSGLSGVSPAISLVSGQQPQHSLGYIPGVSAATSLVSGQQPQHSLGYIPGQQPHHSAGYIPGFSAVTSLTSMIGTPGGNPYSPFSSAGLGRSSHNSIPEVKVKRTELPHFNGDHQQWPQFKVLWPKLALPAYKYDEQTLALELQKCLTGDAAKTVESVSIIGPTAFTTMWMRLIQFYDDPARAVRAALKKLDDLKAVREEDYRGLTHFINEIEASYSQLTTLNQLQCLSLRDVDYLAELLPYSVKKEWHRLYHRFPEGQRLYPFPAFMSFLDEERRVISRLVDGQNVGKKKLSSHYGEEEASSLNSEVELACMRVISRLVDGQNLGKKTEEKALPLNPEVELASHVTNRPPITHNQQGNSPHQAGGRQETGRSSLRFKQCAVHTMDTVKHTTEDCASFRKLSLQEKLEALKVADNCFRCFQNHRSFYCRRRDPCAVCGDSRHHTLLCRREERAPLVVPKSSHATHAQAIGVYAIFKVPVDSQKQHATVFADDGSDSSYITQSAAKRLGARMLAKYVLQITTTGGKKVECESHQYEVLLITKTGKRVPIRLYCLDRITSELSKLDLGVISKLFPGFNTSILQRPSTEVDILIGTDYFGLHPKEELRAAGENLSIMNGALGPCLQGSHPLVKVTNKMHANSVKILVSVKTASHHGVITVSHPVFSQPLGRACTPKQKHQSHLTIVETEKIDKYILGEELGTLTTPRCGACRCGKCPLPGHTFSFREEAELKVIRDNLCYDESLQVWRTGYPWRKDPQSLPDNRKVVLSTLQKLETKLRKDKRLASIYNAQIEDMVKRGVARIVSKEELEQYNGPCYYISHLGVPNPNSASTPYRIVFNSSQVYKGASLNSHLYKGPDNYLNNQLGILLRWREELVAIVGDIKKMYNSVYLETEEQHTHRFLWGNLESPPATYVMTRVNMGDKPAGAISTEALYLTADKFVDDHPQAARMLKKGTYVDDVLESVPDQETAKDLTKGAEKILGKGGFVMKFWLCSGDKVEQKEGMTRVLGIGWKPEEDLLICQTYLNFSPKRQGIHILPDLEADEVPRCIPRMLTKRMVLSQVMRIYDPMGLVSPFTIQGKLLLRKTWETQLGWDEAIHSDLRQMWRTFLTTLYEVNKLQFPRVLKPNDCIGQPSLIIFSDASDVAYGAAAYIRWKREDNTFWSRLIMSKSRVAPLRKRTTPQLELNAAVLSKRMKEVIIKEMRYKFTEGNIIHLVDSDTVLCMLQKTSTRFKLYEGIRIGEIQGATEGDVSSWSWIPGGRNISDYVTRGKNPSDLGPHSDWYNGPSFMEQPIEEWGLKHGKMEEGELPGEKRLMSSNAAEQHMELMKYTDYSDYKRMLRVLARVLNICKEKRLEGVRSKLSPLLIEKAEVLVVKDVQKSINSECSRKSNKGIVGGRFSSLKPTLVNDIWVVGSRLQFNPMVPENDPQCLLPPQHPVTRLMMVQAHRDTGHRGRDSTLARFRHKFWTPQATKVAGSIVSNCQLCKLRKPTLLTQAMGKLPIGRSKPAPPYTEVAIDLFGHVLVRGDIQKRVTGKAWGVIFTDLGSRAVFIEAVFGYDTASFLLALNKFASCRGYPRVIYSDPGSNFVGASNELREQWERMWKEDGDYISSASASNGLEWRLSSADAPWQNGVVEALVKSCKQALSFTMNDSRLSPFEFSSLLYEVANLLNERPIGTLSNEGSELSVITPNSLLLGRSQAKNPGGWQPASSTSTLQRFYLVQQLSSTFWRQWIKSVAPGLVTDAKWHSVSRNLQPGDIVLVMSESLTKGDYRLARVQQTFPDSEGVVRRVLISYKHYKVGERLVEYKGGRDQLCTRPVQRLALVVPVDGGGSEST